MADNNFFLEVTEETVASWLDGMMSPENEHVFLSMLESNNELAEILDANDDIVETFEEYVENGCNIPLEFAFDFELPELQVNHEDETYDSETDEMEDLPENEWSEEDDESSAHSQDMTSVQGEEEDHHEVDLDDLDMG